MAVMEAPQSSLGVRTRARSQNRSKLPPQTSAGSESSRPPPPHSEHNEPRDSYMELRSRRLEKVARCSIRSGDDVAQAARDLQSSLRDCGRPSRGTHSAASAHESSMSSSRRAFSRHPSATSRDASRARPAQVSSQCSVKGSVSSGVIPRRVAPADSTQSRDNSVSMPQRRFPGILTRNQKQELANLNGQEGKEVNAEAAISGPSRSVEAELFSGDSPMIAESSVKDSQMSSRADTRRRTRESTPDTYIPEVEAPGSTTRTRRPGGRQARAISAPSFRMVNEAPSSNEIEAFFESAEQQERRRFIQRYNFDPLNKRPLRGRYEWFNM